MLGQDPIYHVNVGLGTLGRLLFTPMTLGYCRGPNHCQYRLALFEVPHTIAVPVGP